MKRRKHAPSADGAGRNGKRPWNHRLRRFGFTGSSRKRSEWAIIVKLQNSVMDNDKRDPRTYAILGAAFEVRRQLGSGFLEAVYQDALEREFRAQDIPFRREAELEVAYKGQPLPTTYRADFVCFESVIVELKAIASLGDIEVAQVLNYLKATGLRVGLLPNFAPLSLDYRRLVY